MMGIDIFATVSYLNFETVAQNQPYHETSAHYTPMVTFGLDINMPISTRPQASHSVHFLKLGVGYSVGQKHIVKEYAGEGLFLRATLGFGIGAYEQQARCRGVSRDYLPENVSRMERCELK